MKHMKELKEKRINEGAEKMDIKKLFEEAIVVTSKWVEKNDEETYFDLHDILTEFAEDEANTATWDDLLDFDEGNWKVEYVFNEWDRDEIEILITAGKTIQDIANQPAWIQCIVNIEEFMEDYPVEEYLQCLQG